MNISDEQIIAFIRENPRLSSSAILQVFEPQITLSTLKRRLKQLVNDGGLIVEGRGKASRYVINPAQNILQLIDVERYFEKEIDERKIHKRFNFELFEQLNNIPSFFSEKEINQLNQWHQEFTSNIQKLSHYQYKQEMERLAIDLSWKSSQIEGNTYSLLETERLLKEKITADGKTKEEAIMLLNHKEALDFIIANPNYLNPLRVSVIEDIHSLLIKDLDIDRNIRTTRVGISGSNYTPLDNKFEIKEALERTCELLNNTPHAYTKALLCLVLLSYIQAFNDGNKRTARIIANALLMNQHHCPLSFRTVDSMAYKKAMLIFYEQHAIGPFKQLYMEQIDFAIHTYF
jgi:hypothetical protein